MANSLGAPTKAELEQDLETVETDAADADDTVTTVWDLLFDVDDNTPKDEMLEAIEAACEAISDYDPDSFIIEDDEEAA